MSAVDPSVVREYCGLFNIVKVTVSEFKLCSKISVKVKGSSTQARSMVVVFVLCNFLLVVVNTKCNF